MTGRLAYFRILTGPRNSQVEMVLEEPDGTTRTARLCLGPSCHQFPSSLV